MQFKIDENLPIEIAELLTNAGHNTKTVSVGKLDHLKDNFCFFKNANHPRKDSLK